MLDVGGVAQLGLRFLVVVEDVVEEELVFLLLLQASALLSADFVAGLRLLALGLALSLELGEEVDRHPAFGRKHALAASFYHG